MSSSYGHRPLLSAEQVGAMVHECRDRMLGALEGLVSDRRRLGQPSVDAAAALQTCRRHWEEALTLMSSATPSSHSEALLRENADLRAQVAASHTLAGDAAMLLFNERMEGPTSEEYFATADAASAEGMASTSGTSTAKPLKHDAPHSITQRLEGLKQRIARMHKDLYDVSHSREFGPPPGTWLAEVGMDVDGGGNGAVDGCRAVEGSGHHNNTNASNKLSASHNTVPNPRLGPLMCLSIGGADHSLNKSNTVGGPNLLSVNGSTSVPAPATVSQAPSDISIEAMCRLAEVKQLDAARHVLQSRIINKDLGAMDVQEALKEMSQELQVQLSRTQKQLEKERVANITAAKAHHELILKAEARHETVIGEMRRRHQQVVDRLQQAIHQQQGTSVANATQSWEAIMVEYAARLSNFRGADLTRAAAMEALKEVLVAERRKVEGIYELDDVYTDADVIAEGVLEKEMEKQQMALANHLERAAAVDAAMTSVGGAVFGDEDPHAVWSPEAAAHASVLNKLIRGQHAEHHLVLAGHKAALHVKALEWETHQRGVIEKYEGIIAHLRETSPQAVTDNLRARVEALGSELEESRAKYTGMLKESLDRVAEVADLKEQLSEAHQQVAKLRRGTAATAHKACQASFGAQGGDGQTPAIYTLGWTSSTSSSKGGPYATYSHRGSAASGDYLTTFSFGDGGIGRASSRSATRTGSMADGGGDDRQGARGKGASFAFATGSAVTGDGTSGGPTVTFMATPRGSDSVGSMETPIGKQVTSMPGSPAASNFPADGRAEVNTSGSVASNEGEAWLEETMKPSRPAGSVPFVGSAQPKARSSEGSTAGIRDAPADTHRGGRGSSPNGYNGPNPGDDYSPTCGEVSGKGPSAMDAYAEDGDARGPHAHNVPDALADQRGSSATAADGHHPNEAVGDDERDGLMPPRPDASRVDEEVEGYHPGGPFAECGLGLPDGDPDAIRETIGAPLECPPDEGLQNRVPADLKAPRMDRAEAARLAEEEAARTAALYVRAPASQGVYIADVLPPVRPPTSMADALPKLLGPERFYVTLCRSAVLVEYKSPSAGQAMQDAYIRRLQPYVPEHGIAEARRAPLRPVLGVETASMVHSCFAMTAGVVAQHKGQPKCAGALGALQMAVDHLRGVVGALGLPADVSRLPFERVAPFVLGRLPAGEASADPLLAPSTIAMLRPIVGTVAEIVRLWHEVRVSGGLGGTMATAGASAGGLKVMAPSPPPMITVSSRSAGNLVADRPNSARYVHGFVAAHTARVGSASSAKGGQPAGFLGVSGSAVRR